MTKRKEPVRGQNFRWFYYADDDGNTVQFEVGSERDDVGKDFYGACYLLQRRFNTRGKFVVTVEFYPDEVEDEQ